MRTIPLIALCGSLSGCVQNTMPLIEFKSDNELYDTQHEAAMAFFDSNREKVLELMSTRNEIVGLILICDGKFKFTNYFTSGLYNQFQPVISDQCYTNAVAHTHPDIGGNQNQFSKADLKTAKNYDLYLQSPDMKIRYANRNGVVVVRN